MKKFVIMAALMAATASLAVAPARAQEAPLRGQTPENNTDLPIPAEPYNASGDSGNTTDSTASDSYANSCGDPCANAQVQTTKIDVGEGNPIVGKTEISKSQNIYNSYSKKVVVNKPVERITLSRVVNNRTVVVHLYKPVNQAQALHAVIAAMHKLGIVDKAQLNTVLAEIVHDKIFTQMYEHWGIASKSFVDARIAKAIDPLRMLMLVIALLVAATFFCASTGQKN